MRLTMLFLLVVLIGGSIALALFSPSGYAAQDREHIAASASRTHPAGTDELGRDRAVRLSVALLLGLSGACCASGIASALAVGLGGAAAFCPPWIGRGLLYCGDLFLTLPWLFLLMLVRSALPLTLSPIKSGSLTFLVLALVGAPAFLRVNFERAAGLRRADWLFQARVSGLKSLQIARQILPHLKPLLWAQFLLYVPACIIAEANLGPLGLGLAEPVPSWGNLLANLQGAALLSTSPLVYLPVLLLVLVLVSLELSVFGVEP